MVILDQSYQPWSGDFLPRHRRVAAMAVMGVHQAFAGTITKLTVLASYTFMFGTMGILFLAATFGRSIEWAAGNNVFRMYLGSLFPTGVLIMTLAALVGSRAISRDLRNNAVSMYFSKAITRTDYLLGKWATVSAFLLSATFVPALCLWIGHWAIAKETLTTGERVRDLLAIGGHSLAIVMPMSMYVLALSSISRNAIVPAILWVLTYLGSFAVSEVLWRNLEEEWCKLVSWHNLMTRLGELCYEKRAVKAVAIGRNLGPIEDTMSCGWPVPAAILAAVMVLSAAFILWRLRKFEGQE